MDAYITASITGWSDFELKSLHMIFSDKQGTIELPVTWKSQKSIDFRSRTDEYCYIRLNDISVNEKSADGYLWTFETAEISKCSVRLAGTGKEDFRIFNINLCDKPNTRSRKNLILDIDYKIKVFYKTKRQKFRKKSSK